MLNKVLDRAVGAVSLAAGLARHVVWYVSYQVDRTAKPADAARPEGESS